MFSEIVINMQEDKETDNEKTVINNLRRSQRLNCGFSSYRFTYITKKKNIK